MSIKEFFKSKKFTAITILLGVILLMLVSFAGGIAIGLRKARFSYKWGENYERNFIGPRQGRMGFMPQFQGRDFRNANGLAGTIISISDNNLIVVKDKDNKENTVTVTDKTVISQRRNNLKISDLKVNDQVVIVGNPGDNGTLNASFIRVFERNLNNDANNPAN